MWGAVSVHGLYPEDGPYFRDDILKSNEFKVLLRRLMFYYFSCVRRGKRMKRRSLVESAEIWRFIFSQRLA